MKLLLDTQLLIWSAIGSLNKAAEKYILDQENSLYFSPVSIWEISIKNSLGKPDFTINTESLYRGLKEAGYVELPLISSHALGVAALPDIHKDPFDRILISQAKAENLTLITSDKLISKYPGDIVKV